MTYVDAPLLYIMSDVETYQAEIGMIQIAMKIQKWIYLEATTVEEYLMGFNHPNKCGNCQCKIE